MWYQANISGNIRLADYAEEIEEEKRKIVQELWRDRESDTPDQRIHNAEMRERMEAKK